MGFLRFLFACFVVSAHTGGYVPIKAASAIQCFYIFSGFYMSLVLNEKYQGRGSNLTFYKNRFRKIYPIYWITLFLTILWSIFVYLLRYPGTFSQYVNNWPLSPLTILYLLFANIFLFGLDLIFLFGIDKNGRLYFTSDFNQTEPKLYTFAFNSIAWTLGIELLFYLIAPYVLRKKVQVIFFLFLIGLFLKLGFEIAGLNQAPWNYMFFPTQFVFFMGGALSYHWFRKMRSWKIPATISVALYLFYCITGIFYNDIFPDSTFKNVFLFIETILVIPIAFGISGKSKFDRYLGELSYSIYLSQVLVIMVTAPKVFPKFLGHTFTSITICIVFAIVMHEFVTKPVMKVRSRKKSAEIMDLSSEYGIEANNGFTAS
jgi:peptidoglycan/LPS O-acetylase OafA/YrhL